MILTRLTPSPPIELEVETASASALEDLYRPPRHDWLRLNLIASVNGNAAGAGGTSEALTNRADRRILGAIRRQSDVVLVGATSVRREGYLLPRTAVLAIVTASGDLTGHQLPAELPAGKVIVLCPDDAVSTVRTSLADRAVDIIVLPGSRGTPANIVAALRDRGLQSIVCEGGPSLAGQLIDAGLVDELCLATSPVLTDHRLPLFGHLSVTTGLQLTQLLADSSGGLYARWALKPR